MDLSTALSNRSRLDRGGLALVAQPRSARSLLAQRPRGARIRAAASGNEKADIAGPFAPHSTRSIELSPRPQPRRSHEHSQQPAQPRHRRFYRRGGRHLGRAPRDGRCIARNRAHQFSSPSATHAQPASSNTPVLRRDGSKAVPFVSDLGRKAPGTPDAFDWGDAAIGASAIIGVIALGMGGVLGTRRLKASPHRQRMPAITSS